MADGPIEAPKAHPKRALARGAAEAAVEVIPGGSLLTKSVCSHPSAN